MKKEALDDEKEKRRKAEKAKKQKEIKKIQFQFDEDVRLDYKTQEEEAEDHLEEEDEEDEEEEEEEDEEEEDEEEEEEDDEDTSDEEDFEFSKFSKFSKFQKMATPPKAKTFRFPVGSPLGSSGNSPSSGIGIGIGGSRIVDPRSKILISHMLRKFCMSNFPQEKTAYTNLYDQLKILGILDEEEDYGDIKLFRTHFSEQISNAELKGKTFSSFWSTDVTMQQKEIRNTSRYKTDFEFKSFLGKGGFGSVVKVKNIFDQRIYAIKKILLSDDLNEHEEKKIMREVNLLSKLVHFNIVRYYNSWREENEKFIDDVIEVEEEDEEEEDEFTDEDDSFIETPIKNNGMSRILYIQMEYCQETLREAIDRKIMDEDDCFIYFRQILEGLDYLHKNGIIHRDLKPVWI